MNSKTQNRIGWRALALAVALLNGCGMPLEGEGDGYDQSQLELTKGTVADTNTLSTGGRTALPYKCQSTEGSRSCSCSGVRDCFDMGSAGVCSTTPNCNPSNTACVCKWKVTQ